MIRSFSAGTHHVDAETIEQVAAEIRFQFWADQITRLKKLKQVLNIVNMGPDDREEITLSDLVREAVDDYLEKQIQQISQGGRTEE